MITQEKAKEISKEYLEKAKLSNCEITEIQDKIYKWVVKATTSGGKAVVEVSKSSGAVIGYEKV